jgi:hypothetical protein
MTFLDSGTLLNFYSLGMSHGVIPLIAAWVHLPRQFVIGKASCVLPMQKKSMLFSLPLFMPLSLFVTPEEHRPWKS